MFKRSLISAALLSPLNSFSVQRASNTGQQIPQPPVLERPSSDLSSARHAPVPSAGPAGTAFRIDALEVTGETLFSNEELIAATDFWPGSELNLAELRSIAAQMARYYRNRGYSSRRSICRPKIYSPEW